ncbi:Multifunctional protein surE [Includes: 5'/3'-nucleotidase (EC 3.1.3.6) (Nucleoside monophosphate phosphohydrolase); Exopolyphosphatase (EC 3.6.1.11)] [Halobacteriovorax marinus SJ]|uniref:5'-nucleotidase SurE n=1 Tax=Halobacteriovorax marinus (strain ATCC BAA-682 / DSM 15412 / SJ) TaxID=862908 RepID=E1X2D2_HALMS|nr:5'/3'-nucleotidase SurE [Halobacteriovorax marinus]CBW26699.1 Multifunctional protein surE [Includes: 5'/3'-nucleotidase (EC 3.1.3.6) (Nucleoside monophosphate phosphohydrolase); Exopolyphosphatase (EC 3.6.1.11)] [Halobacteriovorax marinus SJ]
MSLNIVISNDDGVYAPGINILFEVLSEIANVTMVAPLEERSTTGHTLTLDHPLRVVKIKENIYGCSGYPADCALMGFGHIANKESVDLFISGINRGANLGQDIYYSGTVAAAREATFHNIPSIAVSSAMDFASTKKPDDKYFYTAANFIKKLVQANVHKLIEPMTLLNINVPEVLESEVKGVELAHLGFRRYSENIDMRTDFRNREYFWIGGKYNGHNNDAGSDCSVIDEEKISFTCLNLLSQSSEEPKKWSEFLDSLK